MLDEILESIPDIYVVFDNKQKNLTEKIYELRKKRNDIGEILNEKDKKEVTEEDEEIILSKESNDFYIKFKSGYLYCVYYLGKDDSSFISFWFDYNHPDIELPSILESEYIEFIKDLYHIFKPLFIRTACSIEDGEGVIQKKELKQKCFKRFHWIQILSRDVSNFEKVGEITSDPRIEKKIFNDGQSIFTMLKDFSFDFIIELENQL